QRRALPLHAAPDPLPQGARVASPAQLLRGRGAARRGLARREAGQARLDAGVALARDADPAGAERRDDLRDRSRALGAEGLRAAAAASGKVLAPLPGHEPAPG